MPGIKWLTAGVVVFMAIATGLTYFMPRVVPTAELSAVASVQYVGPGETTVVDAEFTLGPDGTPQSIRIVTVDEVVRGAVTGLTSCNGHTDFEANGECGRVAEALTGKLVTSHHTSTAFLTVSNVITSDGALLGLAPGPVELVYGTLTGTLAGTFVIGDERPLLTGQAQLTIEEGSTGVYACFVGLGTAGSLTPCVAGLGGQMFPVQLNVVDTGTFEVIRNAEHETGTPILSMSGQVAAEVRVPGETSLAGGSIQVLDVTATLD